MILGILQQINTIKDKEAEYVINKNYLKTKQTVRKHKNRDHVQPDGSIHNLEINFTGKL